VTLPKKITVASQKGGVAKTTTCVSVGANLVEMGYRVLLIDLDPQAHLTISSGLAPGEHGASVVEVLLGEAPIKRIIRETGVPNLHLALADQKLSLLDKRLYGREDYEHLLEAALKTIDPGFYDTIIVDCPPFLGTLMLNALTVAEMLIIPTQCEYYASRSLRQMLELVQMVRQKTNPNLAYRVLITMFDKRSRLNRRIQKQMKDWLERGLLQTVVEMDAKLRESAALGQPITQYAPKARAAIQYRALAQELIDIERE